jgi:hypothetical protein
LVLAISTTIWKYRSVTHLVVGVDATELDQLTLALQVGFELCGVEDAVVALEREDLESESGGIECSSDQTPGLIVSKARRLT